MVRDGSRKFNLMGKRTIDGTCDAPFSRSVLMTVVCSAPCTAELSVYGNSPVSFSAKSHFQPFGNFPRPSPRGAILKRRFRKYAQFFHVSQMAANGCAASFLSTNFPPELVSGTASHRLETDPDLPS